MSPLFNHLSPGDLITHVDDVFLGEGGDAWSSYLSGSEIGDEGMGWCVDRAVYNGESGWSPASAFASAHLRLRL
jgi:hypothetical protein